MMKTVALRIVFEWVCIWLIATMVNAADVSEHDQNWPAWRGPNGNGVAPHANPPIQWSENGDRSTNIRWKTALPGRGHSTPIVWNNHVFLTAAVPFGDPVEPKPETAPGAHDNAPVTSRYRFVVLAIDRDTGDIQWQQDVTKGLPHEGGHVTGSLASASPVTDGRHVYAFFGSRGLYCLDFAGVVQWRHEFGEMRTKHAHGEGSSPVLSGDTLVVNWDHEGQSFLAAIDKRTGVQRWKTIRDEGTSWATPIIANVDGQPQVVVSGTRRIRGYDLATGKVIWECGGLSANVVASPVAGHGMVFAGSSYDHQAMLAIRLAGAKGDVTDSGHVAWSRDRGTPYVPSPLLYGDAIYYHSHYQGVLTRIQATTGKDKPGAFRLPGIRNVYASPVAAADRIYITARDGRTLVLSHGDIPRVIAMNTLNDVFNASAAIVGNQLLLRGEKHLYNISSRPTTSR